jgi:hypothetical protein
MRVNEHLDAARRHDDLAQQSWQWPDTRSMQGAPATVPWVRSWDAGGEHERAASAHRGKADELVADYQRKCGQRTTDEVAQSPLHRYGMGGFNTSSGIVIYLAPGAGPADKLVADIDCHRAWMMLGPANMDDCPLDLPGVHLDARGDEAGITVTLVVENPKLVPELQRRAMKELEHRSHGEK